MIADHIIILDQGKIVFDGTKEELYLFDCSNYNVELPNLMKLEKELGYDSFMDEEEFINKVGETL